MGCDHSETQHLSALCWFHITTFRDLSFLRSVIPLRKAIQLPGQGLGKTKAVAAHLKNKHVHRPVLGAQGKLSPREAAAVSTGAPRAPPQTGRAHECSSHRTGGPSPAQASSAHPTPRDTFVNAAETASTVSRTPPLQVLWNNHKVASETGPPERARLIGAAAGDRHTRTGQAAVRAQQTLAGWRGSKPWQDAPNTHSILYSKDPADRVDTGAGEGASTPFEGLIQTRGRQVKITLHLCHCGRGGAWNQFCSWKCCPFPPADPDTKQGPGAGAGGMPVPLSTLTSGVGCLLLAPHCSQVRGEARDTVTTLHKRAGILPGLGSGNTAR
ncbi:PREDICTED: uncharacterized protein LOC102030055 [Chinchilla lanigera]|uniref:uncharacterized protein LOC102030055 n=1 Tax=Chinchilla lanigera TaxID=34839 RepID=UPI00038EBFB8|nr:PREDICTED: uncharacterized protein LOC102030055 [Chinchilla lanigera]